MARVAGVAGRIAPAARYDGDRLSQSEIWALQRRYFTKAGIEAWRTNTVPSYVTVNPFIAGTYVEMVRAFARDCRAAGHDDPVTVVELGAGSGRFAHGFLSRWCDEAAAGEPPPLRYVMTDVSPATLKFWRGHQRFRGFVEQGILDFALYNAEAGGPLRTSRGPLVVIANYVFDGLTQDLFRVAGGRLEEGLASVAASPADTADDPADRIAELTLDYRWRPCGSGYYGRPDWDLLLESRRRGMGSGAFLMPVGALACLERMVALADGPLAVLSCDRGDVDPAWFEETEPPQPLRHGSFSFPVDYGALAGWTRGRGGAALVPDHPPASIAVVALAFGLPAGADALIATYDRVVRRFGPDDFFMLKRGFDTGCDTLDLKQILAFLRLSAWDPAILLAAYDRLVSLLGDVDGPRRRALRDGLLRLWKGYLPLGEPEDVAFRVGSLLAGLSYPADAVPVLEESVAAFGDNPATLANLAHCRAAILSTMGNGRNG